MVLSGGGQYWEEEEKLKKDSSAWGFARPLGVFSGILFLWGVVF